MKALTIIQPWATLIALGEKQFETRSWRTHYRGSLAIHAGKQVDRHVCEQEPFKSVLAKYGFTADNLPTGTVLAVANLLDCHAITMADRYIAAIVGHSYVDGNEFSFGWYESGRYAWELTDVQRLPEPVEAKGQQGLWNWEAHI